MNIEQAIIENTKAINNLSDSIQYLQEFLATSKNTTVNNLELVEKVVKQVETGNNYEFRHSEAELLEMSHSEVKELFDKEREVVTLDALQAKVIYLCEKMKHGEIADVLKQFKAKKLQDISEADYAQVFEKLDEVA